MSDTPNAEAPPEEEVPLEDQYVGDPPDDEIPVGEPDAGSDAEEATKAPPEDGAPPAPVVPVTGKQLQLDAETISAANQVGIAPQEALLFSSQRALDNEIIRRAHEHRIREGAKPAAPYKLSLDELGLDDVDPAVKEALGKVSSHYEKRMEDMQARLGDFEKQQQDAQQQAQAAHVAENQRTFNKWRESAPQLDAVLGTDQIQDLRPGTPEHDNMVSLTQEIFVLSKAEALRPGGSRATPQDIFNRAASIVFADEMNQQGAAKLKTALKKRSNQRTQKPAARQAAPNQRDTTLDKWDQLHTGDGTPIDTDPDPEV